MDGPDKAPPKSGIQPPAEVDEHEQQTVQQEPVTGSDGRTVTPQEPDSIVASASAMIGPDEHTRTRFVSRTMTREEKEQLGKELEASREALKTLISTNKLRKKNKFGLECDRDLGFSEASLKVSIIMEQLRELIREHVVLLDRAHGVTGSSSRDLQKLERAARIVAGRGAKSAEDRALVEEVSLLPDADARRDQYWTERGYIGLYTAFCRERYQAANRVIPQLERILGLPVFNHRINEFIPHTLEFMNVLEEEMRCQIALRKVADLEDSVKDYNKAGRTVALLSCIAEPVFYIQNRRDELRQFLAAHEGCFEHWLTVYGSSDRAGHDYWDYSSLVVSAIVADKPEVALNLLRYYGAKIRNGVFPAKDCFRFCMSLMSAMTWLYDRPEPLHEHRQRIEGARRVVQEFGSIIQDIDKNKLLPENERAGLLQMFVQVDNHFKEERDKLLYREREITDRGEGLIREEEAVKQKIQNKLAKRERRRLERQEARRKTEEKKQSQQPVVEPPVAEAATASDEEVLHPSLKKAMEAFVAGEANGVIKAAFDEVINDPQASAFDKAQAQYGYTDILVTRFPGLIEELLAMADAASAYEQILKSGQLPPPQDDFRFNDALKQFKNDVPKIQIASIQLAQAMKKALDAFFQLEESQDDFMEQLVELHEQMDVLIALGKKVTESCKRLPDIYELRGKVLKRHKIKGKGSRESRQSIREQIATLKNDAEKLGVSLNLLENSLDRSVVSATAGKVTSEATAKTSEQPERKDQVPSAEKRPKSRSPSPKRKPEHRRKPASSRSRPVVVAGQAPAYPQTTLRDILESLPEALQREIIETAHLSEVMLEPVTASAQLPHYTMSDCHPSSGKDPHPLTILVYHLGRPVLLKTEEQRWLVRKGEAPIKAEGVSISKLSLKLNIDFSVPEQHTPIQPPDEPVVLPVGDTTETTNSAEAGATNAVVASKWPDLPPEFFIPNDVVGALQESMKESKQPWKIVDKGLIVESEPVAGAQASAVSTEEKDWQVAGSNKKKRPGKSRQQVEKKGKQSVPEKSVAAAAKKPAGEETSLPVSGRILQVRLRDCLNRLLSTGKLSDGSPLPKHFSLEGVMARVQDQTFMESPDCAPDDFAILSEALGVPIRMTSKSTEVVVYQTGLAKPKPVAMNEYPDTPYLSLEFVNNEGSRMWFASVAHYFGYSEEQLQKDWAKEKEKPKVEAKIKTSSLKMRSWADEEDDA